MSNFFSMDNGFFSALGKLCDIVILSIVFVLLCIPVVTIGPANTALYYAIVKVIRRERGYLFREFFKSFRLNFMKGAIIGLILTTMFAVLALDIIMAWAALSDKSSSNSILFGIYIAISFLLICFTIYVFPVLSRFDMKLGQLIKTSGFMSIRHLPSTISMVLVLVGGIVAIMYVPILIFVIPAVVVFLNSFLMERIFKKYMPKEEGTQEDTSKDEWYLE